MIIQGRTAKWCWFAVFVFFGRLVPGCFAECSCVPCEECLFRFGFSLSMFGEVNKNDATAAMKVWTTTLAEDMGLPISTEPVILYDTREIIQALRSKSIDAVVLLASEYYDVRDELDQRSFISRNTEESYVVLVRKDSPVDCLEDLQGESVTFWRNTSTSLAQPWLDVALLKKGFAPIDQYCLVTDEEKLSKTVLPVFFRQRDACVVTLSGFEAMVEMNPQVGRQLRVLVRSEEYVPNGCCFRRGYESYLRSRVEVELGHLLDTPSGQQLQTLFRFDAINIMPISCFDKGVALMETHRRLCDEYAAKGQIAPHPSTVSPAVESAPLLSLTKLERAL